MEKKRQNDNDWNRNADQPKQDTLSHETPNSRLTQAGRVLTERADLTFVPRKI